MEIYNKISSGDDGNIDFDLDIEVNGPGEVPEKLRKKWGFLMQKTSGSGDAPYLIFLGEIMEILDAGSPCEFNCQSYDGPDMFGGYDIRWSLETENLLIERELKCRICESWQRLEYEADTTRIAGFVRGKGIEWNGSTGGVLAMGMRILGLSEEFEEMVKKLAHSLFHEVSLTRTMVA